MASLSTMTSTITERRVSPAWPLIGGTPLLRFDAPGGTRPGVEIYGKAEWFNPSGSVKDRPAAAILRRALDEGRLEGGRILLDSTSGNMGIAYATLAAAARLRLHLVIPANCSPERIAILKALGARFTLSDPLEGSEGARAVAAEMAQEAPDRYYYADQYSNPANWEAHFKTTGPEIWSQTKGRLTHFVAGMGTSGTIVGAGRYLHSVSPGARVVGVQPDNPLHGLEGLKHLETSVVPAIYDPDVVDEVIPISTERTYALLRRIADEEGLLLGVSAGAALLAAFQLVERLERGVIVAILPDSGHKYLSEPFWEAR